LVEFGIKLREAINRVVIAVFVIDIKFVIQFRFTVSIHSNFQSNGRLPSSHQETSEAHVLKMDNHISPPTTHLAHHDQLEVDQQRDSVFPQSTPAASQYMSSVYRYSQAPAAIPIVPSPSWGPIPSVHRESLREGSELEESFRSQLYGSERKSWAVPEFDGNFYDSARVSPTATKEPNIASQERTYIDYSMGRISKPESEVCQDLSPTSGNRNLSF